MFFFLRNQNSCRSKGLSTLCGNCEKNKYFKISFMYMLSRRLAGRLLVPYWWKAGFGDYRFAMWSPGPEAIKIFSCSTHLSMKFIMLINVKMPTICGILIFMSMINTTSEHLKARKVFIFKHCRFYENLKYHAQLR